MPAGTPKTPQAILDQCKLDYLIGNWKSITELAIRHGLHPRTLCFRIKRESWEEERQRKLTEANSKIEETRESIVEKYLKKTFARAEKYERIIDASRDNLGSKDKNGTPLLDPDAINTYTLAEARIHELAKSALRIPDAKSLDITTKGQSLGEDLAQAIQRLRENPSVPKLDDSDLERILEAEIIDDEVK